MIPLKLKLIAGGLALIGAFGFGVWVTKNHYKAKLTDAYVEANEQLVAQVNYERTRTTNLLNDERERAAALARAKAESDARAERLQEEIANANLADIRTPATPNEAGGYSCPAPLGSPDFIRLWNNAANSADGTPTGPR